MKILGRVAILIIVILLALSVPVLVAGKLAGNGYVFNGFLYNPLDGNSYLAKMIEGARGDWKFTLPYTAQPGTGAYLFLFYILLGKISGLLCIPMIISYHVTRILCSLFLLIELWKFCKHVFIENEPLACKAFCAAVLFSGMGWLGIALNRLTPDFSVPEAYIFLSSYANPHFPLSLALILLTLRLVLLQKQENWQFWLLLIGFVLANLSPFSVVVTILIIGSCTLWNWIALKRLEIRNALLFGIGALPVLIYQIVAIKSDPILSAWDAQNLTPAPALLDLLIAFLPGLLLSLGALVLVIREKRLDPPVRMLFLWMGLGFILTYLPLNLQRRFLVGLSIPVAILAVFFIEKLMRLRVKRFLAIGFYTCMIPTILLIVVMGLSSVASHNLQLVVFDAEQAALQWIKENTDPDSIILSSADIGNLIPAQTGRRVIYGHNFETTYSEQKINEVQIFFSGELDPDSAQKFINQNQISYIFLGPREKALGSFAFLRTYQVLFTSGNVEIIKTVPSK